MIKVRFKKLNENAELPKYAHKGDIGMDVKAIGVEYDANTDTYIYYTGLACETKCGVGIFGMMRSSNYKTDCYLTNGVGLIDSATYRGDIQFRYKNRTSMKTRIELEALRTWNRMSFFSRLCTNYDEVYAKTEENCMNNALRYAPYEVGDKIGQLVAIEFDETSTKLVKKLSETERGEGGHGSTGK